MHLCAGLTAASWIMEPFGEIGANFSLQLSSRTQFAKISKKKVIAENQCEKHKIYSLATCKIFSSDIIFSDDKTCADPEGGGGTGGPDVPP